MMLTKMKRFWNLVIQDYKKITERIDKAEMERVLERCEDTMDNFCHDGFSWDIGHNPPGENAVILNGGRIENK